MNLVNLNHRRILTALSVVFGLPVAVSLGLGDWTRVEHLAGASHLPDPLGWLLGAFGLSGLSLIVGLLLASGLALADVLLEWYRGWYEDELYAILKELGERISGGASVEAAAHQATSFRRTPPAWVFQEALRLAGDVPLDQALRHVSARSGQRAMVEIGGLVASALQAGGDFGPALRWLASHFQRLRLLERSFTGSLSSSLVILRVVSLVAAPFMYSTLVWRFADFNGEPAKISVFAVAFFYTGVVGMVSLDGLVYGRWDRVLPKLPLFLGLTRVSLGL
jgi:hypothetical protein